MKAMVVCVAVLLGSVIAVAGPGGAIDDDAVASNAVLNDACAGDVAEVSGDATEDPDSDLSGFQADFAECPGVWMSIESITDGQVACADETLLTCQTMPRLDDHEVATSGFVTTHAGPSLSIANVSVLADRAGAVDEIESDLLVQTPPAMIPVPRVLLLAASVTACVLCGLRKCRCL